MSTNQVQLLISVPVSVDALQNMSPSEIVAKLATAGDVQALSTEVAQRDSAIRSFGASLELILDEVDNPLDKAKALRSLAADMKKWGRK